MALAKAIELDNGVTVNYHRIVMLNIHTNVANVIEVCSYTSQAKREEERTAIEGAERAHVFTHTSMFSAPYDQSMTVETAYQWLKENVEDFSDAEDVLEQG